MGETVGIDDAHSAIMSETMTKLTYDLASESKFWNGEENIETEHEKMFMEQGIKIKALIATNKV